MKPAPSIYPLIIACLIIGQARAQKKTSDFLSKGDVILQTLKSDLNNDGLEDCVLLIKGTDRSKIVSDEYKGQLDRNRRGIIILFKKANQYELIVKNNSCFSSENEDGGVYFPPEMSVKIERGRIYVHYAHGRYGFWRYTFRLQNNDFELIGYDQSENHGPVVNAETSINFLSKKKLTKVNTNANAQGGDEIFKETWKTISVGHLIKLSQINDFDELDMKKY
jgi:hypothetical protein